MLIRAATADDIPFLWRMLTFAASMQGSAEDVASARQDPTLVDYVRGFGRPGDVGVIAVEGGAAWVRLAPEGPISESKVWTREIPELAIATLPEQRGKGLGSQLLEALFVAIRGQHAAVALTVREANPAVRLYERMGFRTERKLTNRVGTVSLAMKWTA